MQSTKSTAEPLPNGTWYTGRTHLHDLVKHIPLSTAIIGCSHHPKAVMLQKEATSIGITTSIYDQTFLDHDLLHRFFTKAAFTDSERYCAIKYIMHTSQHHGSYHAVNASDHRRVRALQLTTPVASSRRIYQHHQLFQACSDGLIPHQTQIILMDKEWLFNNRQKRKYGPTEIYHLADQIEAIIYKYTLLEQNTHAREQLLHALYIFLGVWEGACQQLFADMRIGLQRDRRPNASPTTQPKSQPVKIPTSHTTPEEIRVDHFFENSYFTQASALWTQLRAHVDTCFQEYGVSDSVRVEQMRNTINERLSHPVTIIHKRAHHEDRYTIQPVDTYTSRDDIMQFFTEFELTVISVLDSKLPTVPFLPESLLPAPLLKWKEMVVSDSPRLCLLAPSKRAAQELFMSLHKSKAYADTFL